MACNIETFAYPAWWAGATTVQVTYAAGGNSGSLSKASVEFLPQGVATAALFLPWSAVADVQKLT